MADYFNLYCRGPFNLHTVHNGVSAIFRKTDAASSEDGSNLDPGTCAFGDRPVGPDEPRAIRFTTSATSASQLWHLAHVLTRSDYVAVLSVTNTGDVFELEDAPHVRLVALT
jgi:hypothetical protein